MSSFTLPVRSGASPTTLRIAEVSIAGVASAGRSVTRSMAPASVVLPAALRKWRRVDRWSFSMVLLVAQRCEIGHDILDLFRRQDRLVAPALADPHQAVDTVIGRHDCRGIEPGRIDQPQPELADAPAAAGAGQVGGEIALEPGLRERSRVTEDAGAGTVEHERAAARG